MRWPPDWFRIPIVRWIVGLGVVGMAFYALFIREHPTFVGQIFAFGVMTTGIRVLPLDRREHGAVLGTLIMLGIVATWTIGSPPLFHR